MSVKSIRGSSLRNSPERGGLSLSVDGGTTGLLFQFITGDLNDTFRLAGTLSAANGGTGTGSLNGYVKGNGDGPMTASEGIPAADISTPIDCGTF